MLDWISDNMEIIVAVLVLALVGGIMLGILAAGWQNEANRIDCGIITDKQMDAGGTYYTIDKNGGRLHSYPPSYSFTITGEKDGAEVSYTFEVSESEYNSYKIGDFYER